jgi:hypothetical protein
MGRNQWLFSTRGCASLQFAPRSRGQLRVPENDDVPKSPSTTLPLTSSPSIVPLNSSVIGIGSVIETFQDIAFVKSQA